jgi:xanthosine utilization system XapX-like protein
MRYYLAFVGLGLLMGGLCVLLNVHTTPPPAIAMVGLFGAHADQAGDGAGLPA